MKCDRCGRDTYTIFITTNHKKLCYGCYKKGNQMPVYNFYCKECKIEQDYMMKNWEEKALCPKCGKEMKKNMSLTNFKVNGYNYKNNYGLK